MQMLDTQPETFVEQDVILHDCDPLCRSQGKVLHVRVEGTRVLIEKLVSEQQGGKEILSDFSCGDAESATARAKDCAQMLHRRRVLFQALHECDTPTLWTAVEWGEGIVTMTYTEPCCEQRGIVVDNSAEELAVQNPTQ